MPGTVAGIIEYSQQILYNNFSKNNNQIVLFFLSNSHIEGFPLFLGCNLLFTYKKELKFMYMNLSTQV